MMMTRSGLQIMQIGTVALAAAALAMGAALAQQQQTPPAEAESEAEAPAEGEAPAEAEAEAEAAPAEGEAETEAAPAAGAASAAGAAAPGEAPAEGEAAAEAAPPPPPEHLEACGAERCLTAGFSPELQQALDAGTATLEQIAQGLTFAYEGLEPVRVYFVAARYNDDRLVRYDVSNAINIDPGMASFPDVTEVVTNALGPRTESGVTAGSLEAEVSAPNPEFVGPAFVGSMPANTLMQMVRPDLTEPLGVEQRSGVDEVGVFAIITRDAALRENLGSKSFGAAVRLNYVD